LDLGLGPNDQVKALAVEADGGVTLGGMFTAVNGQPFGSILSPDSLDPVSVKLPILTE